MKRHRLVTAILIVALALINGQVRAGGENSPPPRGPTVGAEPSSDPRQAAAELLNGRDVLLRLYVDWKTDPKAYTTLKVPLGEPTLVGGLTREPSADNQEAAAATPQLYLFIEATVK